MPYRFYRQKVKMEIICGFENYTIKFDGTITNNKRKCVMSPFICNRYLRVTLRNSEGKQIHHYIHRLLALHFIANPDNLPCIDHIDGNSLNNNLQNLHWVTHQQNDHNRQNAKGYCFDRWANKWKASIMNDGVLKHLGNFNTKEEARDVYCKARLLRNKQSGAVMDFN